MITATKISLSKTQTLFTELNNATGVQSGSVAEIGEALAECRSKGCVITFSIQHAPNVKRCFNAAVKRANRIAAVAGVELAPPAEYFIKGHRMAEQFFMEVL